MKLSTHRSEEQCYCVSYDTLTAHHSEKVTDKTPVPPPDWEVLVAQIADEIMAEHTPARLLQVRAKLYDLLSHCIPPTTVLKVHLTHLIKLKLCALNI